MTPRTDARLRGLVALRSSIQLTAAVAEGLRFLEGDTWRNDWNSKTQKGLPKAVEIELKIVVTGHDQKTEEQTFKTTVTFVR